MSNSHSTLSQAQDVSQTSDPVSYDVKLQRLTKAFLKKHIHIERTASGWTVRNQHASAEILLPASFELEEKAVTQLLNFASVHPSACACATPDFHPGTHAPVGAVVATDSDVVIPRAIGTDINCGMRSIKTGLALAQVAPHKAKLVQAMKAFLLEGRRNVPLQVNDFKRLYNDGPEAFMAHWALKEGQFQHVNVTQRETEWKHHVGLAGWRSHEKHAPDLHTQSTHGWIRDPQLGTPGSGNHFVEVQVIEKVLDHTAARQRGLRENDVILTLHSGSRDVGFHVGGKWMDIAKHQWPMHQKHPQHGLYALSGELATTYMEAMGTAARYAWLNRFTMDECLRLSFENALGVPQWELLVDVPHNVITREFDRNIHRKGATPAHAGQWGVIPGSMGDASYIIEGLGNPEWLHSCSHGAGRAVRRQAMRVKDTNTEANTWECITLNETRRMEEHPSAYKPIGPVIESQVEHHLIKPLFKLKPWFTFKA